MPPLASIQYPTLAAICHWLTMAVSGRLLHRQRVRRTWRVSFLSSSRAGPTPPRDLIAEIDAELLAARRKAVWDDARVLALEELLETTRHVVRELRRPATLTDLLTTAPSAAERHRRRRLLQALRRSSDG